MPFGFFKSLKLLTGGTLLKRVDAHIDYQTKFSMKLKFDRDSGRRYVVLSSTIRGGSANDVYEIDEFLELTEKLSLALNHMRAAVQT